MPMLIDLLPAQMVTFAAIARELEANGFEVEPFGPRTIAIKAAPAGLEGSALERMLVEVLEQAEQPGTGRESGGGAHPDRSLDRLSRGHQSQYPARSRAHGMAAGGAGANRASHQLPPWASDRPAVCLEGNPAGISSHLGRSLIERPDQDCNKCSRRAGTTKRFLASVHPRVKPGHLFSKSRAASKARKHLDSRAAPGSTGGALAPEAKPHPHPRRRTELARHSIPYAFICRGGRNCRRPRLPLSKLAWGARRPRPARPHSSRRKHC